MTSDERAALGALPALPRDEEGPVFKSPWEAHAFALAVELSEKGLFTWGEWSRALSAEIARAKASGDPDLGDTYYEHWLAALEKLAREKGLVDETALAARRDEWRRAYVTTPHGEPVELAAGRGGVE